MYIQARFEETRIPLLHALIGAHPLATFVTSGDGEICADHFPLLLGAAGKYGVLRGHIPRANPLARKLNDRQQALAVFQGPAAYVTPGWYPSKQEHGRVVPTWNYVVVQAAGNPRLISDPEWLRAHLHQLTEQQERDQTRRWAMSDAPDEFIATMLNAIIGIEMPITSLAGKWKVSQNRPEADRQGVVAGLRARNRDADRAMADLVAGRLESENLPRPR